MALIGKQQKRPVACAGRLKELWFFGPEKKQEGRQVLSIQKALLKRKGKNCSLCLWHIRGKIMELHFYQRTLRSDTGKTF